MLKWIKKSKCRFAQFIRQVGKDYAKNERKNNVKGKDTDRIKTT